MGQEGAKARLLTWHLAPLGSQTAPKSSRALTVHELCRVHFKLGEFHSVEPIPIE